MAIQTEYITQHDLQPTYKVTVVDSSAIAINLTSAVIRVNMKNEDSTALTLNRSTVGITITSATLGQFEYAWQAADTASTGTFDIEFEITPLTGGKFTIPNKIPSQSTSVGVAKVVIKAGLDAT